MAEHSMAETNSVERGSVGAGTSRSAQSRRGWRPVAWAFLGLVIVAALAIGGFGRRPTEGEDRVMSLAGQIKCVTCVGESVEGSQSDFAVNAREDIRTRVADGKTDEEIFGYFSSKYDDVLLNPSASGVNALVWILPVLVGGVAVAGAAFTIRQRSEDSDTRPSAEDRRLVEAALDDFQQRSEAHG